MEWTKAKKKGTPYFISSAIMQVITLAAALLTGLNQDGIGYPELRVTGILAAVGQLVLRWLDLIAARLDDKLGSSLYTLKIRTNSCNIMLMVGTGT